MKLHVTVSILRLTQYGLSESSTHHPTLQHYMSPQSDHTCPHTHTYGLWLLCNGLYRIATQIFTAGLQCKFHCSHCLMLDQPCSTSEPNCVSNGETDSCGFNSSQIGKGFLNKTITHMCLGISGKNFQLVKAGLDASIQCLVFVEGTAYSKLSNSSCDIIIFDSAWLFCIQC